jgi:hypothetical protein
VSQPELLKLVARQLAGLGIEYMITGSLASSLQGEPRATHDIDVVLEVRAPAPDVARRLKAAFPEPDFYLDETAVREAISARGMFNLIDAHEGDKVDFWLLTDEEYDRERFHRREVALFESTALSVSRPEDTILMKLRWAAMLGGSEKHFTDVVRVYEVQHGRLDEAYLDRWAATLGVTAALARARAEARPIE